MGMEEEIGLKKCAKLDKETPVIYKNNSVKYWDESGSLFANRPEKASSISISLIV